MGCEVQSGVPVPDVLVESSYSPEYPASIAFVLRKMRAVWNLVMGTIGRKADKPTMPALSPESSLDEVISAVNTLNSQLKGEST